MANASLTVVGSGIKLISHLTTETKAYIKQSDVVLYLVNDPLMKEWIEKNNSHAESLDSLYTKYPLRLDCYRAIQDYILDTLFRNQHVCVVLYGHPTVYSQIALDAVKKARLKGYDAKILPAISAEACLFSDLLVDPGSCGCQSFEATDLLIHRRQFNTASHLILWQVGVIGALTHSHEHNNQVGIKTLLDFLKERYPSDHKIIVYEAAQYPSFSPRIDEILLDQLPEAKLSRITTLYLPPCSRIPCNEEILNLLKINCAELG